MSREARMVLVWHTMLAAGAVLILAMAILWAGGSSPGVIRVDDRTGLERWNDNALAQSCLTSPAMARCSELGQ